MPSMLQTIPNIFKNQFSEDLILIYIKDFVSRHINFVYIYFSVTMDNFLFKANRSLDH